MVLPPPVEEKLDHCGKDALTGFLGLMLQAVLAGLAFTCLIGKEQVFFRIAYSICNQSNQLFAESNSSQQQSEKKRKALK